MTPDPLTLRLRNDLEVAAQTLRRYEALHRAKGTPESTEKAEVNAALAGRFEATLRIFDGALAAMPDMEALAHVIPPRFLEVACSQCGGTFGPGEHGFSSCPAHQGSKGPV